LFAHEIKWQQRRHKIRKKSSQDLWIFLHIEIGGNRIFFELLGEMNNE